MRVGTVREELFQVIYEMYLMSSVINLSTSKCR